MNLADKMKRFPTINLPNCAACGNPWFFARGDKEIECTTCHRLWTEEEIRTGQAFKQSVKP